MDRKEMCAMLPTKMPREMERSIFLDYLDELGGNRTFYKRVSLLERPELQPLMAPSDWEAYERNKQSHWAAACTCSSCGETWYTQWNKGGSISVIDAEDGQIYPCFDEESPEPGQVIHVAHNDGLLCPVCWSQTTLVRASKSSCFTRRRMFCSIENVGIYTTIICWMAFRMIDSDGFVFEESYPWQAYVLNEAGNLHRYIWHRGEGWKSSRTCSDAFWICYTSGDGVYNNVKGGFVHCKVPSLIGCTGEKTGLYEYITGGGQWPIVYLRTWRKYPQIENLVKTPFIRLVETLIDFECGQYEIPGASLPGLDFSKTRPHEMLHMDRNSYRSLCNSGATMWHRTMYESWIKYQTSGGCASALEFHGYWSRFTHYGVQTLLEMREIYPDIDFPQVDRYFRRQGLSRSELRLLPDTWKMTRRLTGRTNLAHEEIWPRDLRATHDRLMEIELAELAKNGAGLYRAGFQVILDQYGDLQWTDGELCIVLPKDNAELIREGSVLRHCVGSYGKDHVEGNDVIFFVRKYRRPERSYYTLDICMHGEPREKQLHGYGNERHGENKEYRHKIPHKVRAFCDRWKREVLMPWYSEQQAKSRTQKGMSA